MSARDNTFIDAYGLELNDELEETYAEPTRLQPGAVDQPMPIKNTQPGEPSYRFDAGARHRTLRGPHFSMRRVVSPTSDETSAWDALDMNVIDVGAAWAPTPVVVQPSFDEEPVAASQVVEPVAVTQVVKPVAVTQVVKPVAVTQVVEPVAVTQVVKPVAASPVVEPAVADEVAEVEETADIREEIAEVASPIVPQPEVAAVDAKEVTTPEPPTAAAVEAPASIESAGPFAPVWEVDRFKWPDDIEQLFGAQTEYFDYAGKKLVAASREGLSVLAITSMRSGEGSTTLALCLARAAAGAGAKVGLLDGNLVRSELGEKLGVDFASGWQSAATFEQPLAEAAITGLEEGITLFPSATRPVAGVESLGDEGVGQVFRAAAAHFDLLIIDAGQADLGNNVEALDAAIVVRDIRHTSEAETLNVATQLRNRGVKAVGIAENFSRSPAIRAAA